MDSKPKAHSSKGTPLTVKWTAESVEVGNREPERDRGGHLGIVVSAFVIALVTIGFGSWLLGGSFSVHGLLGGFFVCMWLRRWGEKHLGWQRAQSYDGPEVTCSAAEIRKRRLAYTISGFAIGLVAVALSAWLMGEIDWVFSWESALYTKRPLVLVSVFEAYLLKVISG